MGIDDETRTDLTLQFHFKQLI